MFILRSAVVFITVIVNLVSSYKVLVFHPFPGKSLTILGEGYVRHLVDAGHNVTYVTPIPVKELARNLRQIDLSSIIEQFTFGKMLDIKKVLQNEVDIAGVEVFYKNFHGIAEAALKHDNVQRLLLDTSEEFDVAIVQWLYSDMYAGISSVFNCPLIWASTMEPHSMMLRLIDDIPNPAYIPDHRSPINPPLTFSQRVGQLWNLLSVYRIRWNLEDKEITLYNEAYGPAFVKRGRQIPSFEEVKYNGSLMLGNSHVSSGLALRLPQNYIPIAGFHIRKETPLPENLQSILDNATHGVIYFSLGSMMKGKTMPRELKIGLLKTFSELKQTIIWKLEEKLPDLPKNVHLVEWAPQQSILAHPNIVLFITHGGLLSTIETLHRGVPIVGIPLFADQFVNIRRAVAKGFGKHVPLAYDTPAKLKPAIEEILGDSKYREKVKELSLAFNDRPISPGDELVYWVDHVVKTRGAPHLRSVALMVPWYQKLFIDLLGLITVIIFVIVLLFKLLLKYFAKGVKVKTD